MAWLAGYTYRKKITITGQAGAGANYQAKFLIGKSSGATGEQFDLNGHCMDTMLDMRVTDNDEITQLKYWIESVVSSGTSFLATVWVKVTDSLETNQDIYIYYGKAGDSDGSDSANTFIQYHGTASANFSDAANTPPTNICYEGKVRAVSDNHNVQWGLNNADANYDAYALQTESGSNSRYCYNIKNYPAGAGGGYSTANETPKFTTNQWYRIIITSDGTTSHFYVDGDEIATGLTTYFPDSNMGLHMTEHSGGSEQEFSFSRKWVATEPAFSSAGAEETETAAVGQNLQPLLGIG